MVGAGRARRWRCALLAALLSILATAGCQSTPDRQGPDLSLPGAGADPAALLRQAEGAGPERRAALLLEAARLFADAGDRQASADALARVEPALLPRGGLDPYYLLQAQLLLAADAGVSDQRSLREAAAWLSRLSSAANETVEAQLLQAELCARQGNPRCALERAMPLPAEARVNDRIWQYLTAAASLDTIANPPAGDERHNGWWQLKRDMVEARSLAEQRRRFDAFRAARPDHPAAQVPPNALAALATPLWRPRHIGLLLPLSGSLARAGRAVRDGFLAAHLDAAERPRPQVTVYDTAGAPLAGLLEEAAADGVDLLVGPLAKERAAEFAALPRQIPALCLNNVPGDASVPAASLLRLSLAIEDEAGTTARRLERDGHRRVVVFYNADDWSRRAFRRLEQDWPHALTGQALVDLRTVTEAVGRAMAVAASGERHQQLQDLLGTSLEFVPRARQDLDAVVALVDNDEASALVPALKFHFASDLPVYASSQTVRGADADDLAALRGFQVAELPWFLGADALYEVLAEPFDLAGNPFASLYALGADAARVSARVGHLLLTGDAQLLGSTGLLTLEADGRLRRELDWGMPRGGRLRPL